MMDGNKIGQILIKASIWELGSWSSIICKLSMYSNIWCNGTSTTIVLEFFR